MTTTATHRRRTDHLVMSWVSVALIPVGFLLAFAVGEGLYALFGYRPEDGSAPVWVGLLSAGPAIALFLVPCAAAVELGRRALRDGRRSAVVPLALGAAAGLGMLVMNVVSLVAG